MTDVRATLAADETRAGPGRGDDQGARAPDASGRRDGLAESLGTRLDGHHPAVAALITMVAAYVAIATVVAAFGFLLTKVLVADGRGSWDVIGVNQWFADRFTPTVDRWSHAGSFLGDTVTIVGIATVVVIGLLIARRWRPALFVVTALTLEVTVFLTMTLLVDRARPDVPKPDTVPPTSSYPSGHTAAAVAMYVGLAVLVAICLRRRAARVAVLVAGFVVAFAVGLARVVRGMHHPSDTMTGVALGLMCLLAAALVVNVADVVARHRGHQDKEVSP
jgi:undecaprenyl-diphosphatase